MKLKSIQVKNYRSIEDSEKFAIDNITCLVGKNEAGKTAVLKAIEGIKPHDKNMKYDKTTDYPRRYFTQYDERHDGKKAEVCISQWELEDDDIDILESEFGQNCMDDRSLKITRYYDGGGTWELKLNEKKVVNYLCEGQRLDAIEKAIVNNCNTAFELYQKISGSEHSSEKLASIKKQIDQYRENKAILHAIDILSKKMPSFVYFSHYSRMSGALSVDKYRQDKRNNIVEESDEIFEDFLNFAGTSIDEIENIDRHEEFKAKLEAASNSITDQIFKYWTQNANLEIEFEVGQGRREDPSPFNHGTVMRARVKNNIHRASVPFSERSAGFIWFFSFLVHFSQVKKNYGSQKANVIILLDEPRLTLHAKAQDDLLRYIREKLAPHHQVIYSTHSPFMIIPENMASIRTVEDVIQQNAAGRREILGTKVSSDFLKTNRDTVFPLQSAFGYEISQTLFIGKKVILVEGPSDILYLKTISNILKDKGKNYLDDEWAICPTGGIDKIMPFINLFLSHGENRKIIALTDYQQGHKNKVKQLRTLDRGITLLIYSDFCSKEEADVEDLFDASLYLQIIKNACEITIEPKMIDKSKRIIKEIETKFKNFSHYKPADWLLRNSDMLRNDSQEVNNTFDRFENIFRKINEV